MNVTPLTLAKPLVDVQWLLENIDNENLLILDASVPPVVPGFISLNAEGDFRAIPGARRFDYDKEICKPNSALPHMMPSAELFQAKARELGINSKSLIVVYDDVGIYSSPRAWWMLRAMGHSQVAVLDGGLPAWIAAGQVVANDFSAAAELGNFVASEGPGFCDFEAVLAATTDSGVDILDARSAGRFAGTAPEPRPGSRSGHMPGALNLPFADVLKEGRLRPKQELNALFSAVTSPDKKVITSCGSGITACVLTLAASVAGYQHLSVYDGSWAEWGMPSKLPVVMD